MSLVSYMSPWSLICVPGLLYVSLVSYMSPFNLLCVSLVPSLLIYAKSLAKSLAVI